MSRRLKGLDVRIRGSIGNTQRSFSIFSNFRRRRYRLCNQARSAILSQHLIQGEEIHYFSYDDRDDSYACIPVKRNAERCALIEQTVKNFWWKVRNLVQPALMPQDYLLIKHTALEKFFETYDKGKRLIALERVSGLLALHSRILIGKTKIYTTTRGITIRKGK